MVSIIVPVFNALPYLRQCLHGLRCHTPQRHELIVVDNASSPATRRYLHRLPQARVLTNAKNRGFASAVNQGMSQARGKYLVWLNSDAIVPPFWLERLLDSLESSPRTGAVGPMEGRILSRNKGLASEAWALRRGTGVEKVRWLRGFCFMLKAQAARRVGLLDERFFPGGYEDSDYCLRLRAAGYDLGLVRGVCVHHFCGKSFPSVRLRRQAMAVNRRRFIQKWSKQAADEAAPE